MTKFKIGDIVTSRYVDNAFYKIKNHYAGKCDVDYLWGKDRHRNGAGRQFTSIDEDVFMLPTLEQTILLTRLGLLKGGDDVADT